MPSSENNSSWNPLSMDIMVASKEYQGRYSVSIAGCMGSKLVYLCYPLAESKMLNVARVNLDNQLVVRGAIGAQKAHPLELPGLNCNIYISCGDVVLRSDNLAVYKRLRNGWRRYETVSHLLNDEHNKHYRDIAL